MPLRTCLLPYIMLGLSPFACAATVADGPDSNKDAAASLNSKRLDEVVRTLSVTFPRITKLERLTDGLAELLLTVDSREKADQIATQTAAMIGELQTLNEQLVKDLQAYIAKRTAEPGTGYSPDKDPVLQKYQAAVKQLIGLFGVELPGSLMKQGLLTPALQQAFRMTAAIPEQPSPVMSRPLEAYWKENLTLQNKKNSILYSLRTSKDLPRVKQEMAANAAAMTALAQTAKTLYPLNNEQDQQADALMRQRQPLRILNIMLAVLKGRSGLTQPNGRFLPEVRELLRSIR